MAAVASASASREYPRKRWFYNNPHGGGGGAALTKKPNPNPIVCSYWLAGTCRRSPCLFLHPQETQVAKPASVSKPPVGSKRQQSVCRQWVSGNCTYGDRCRFLHSWCRSEDKNFSLLARLDGHKKGVTGIALPVGSDKLYSGSGDGTLRVWDCNSGQCVRAINLGTEVGCLISEGSWVFVGLPDLVKGWRIGDGGDVCCGGDNEVSLRGPVGQVYAMATHNDILFAGAQDGDILAWRSGFQDGTTGFSFDPAGSLEGHSKAVISMTVGAGRLYSGSMDCTIRVWDPEKFQCLHTLKGHDDMVTSLLCWEHYLLSSSLDRKVQIWATTERGTLEAIYAHKEDEGILGLFGMGDAEDKPVLHCSCGDNSVRLYELPSFTGKGKIFATKEVKVIQQGPGGLFFTGDWNGVVSVWKWSAKPK